MKNAIEQASAWMRLPSGRRIDLVNPDPQAWTDYDLALRLARVYRWGGESIHPVPLSVAQHSLAVLELRRQWATEPLTIDQQLRELLHDAEEALLGFDCISKLKPILGHALQKVSECLSAAIASRYRLPAWSADELPEHKRADIACAASEALYCAGWSEYEIIHVLGIAEPVVRQDPLVHVYQCIPWQPWPSDVAVERFYAELQRLLKLREPEVVAQLA